MPTIFTSRTVKGKYLIYLFAFVLLEAAIAWNIARERRSLLESYIR
ncbi:protein of unknown function [Alteromonas macleodii]|uniref:Uncharacterized protein n=1 Tax=Alteromonas macleodii TaxID=28108 RepID=A0A6T9XZM6_ALTMA|nr:protein of unknown function [Alteromonas macleodii]